MILICDVCGREIDTDKREGIVTWKVRFDENGNRYVYDFNIHHNPGVPPYYNCDRAFRDDCNIIVNDLLNPRKIVTISEWIGFIDIQYNKRNPEKVKKLRTIVDYSFVECMKRCLIPGYEEARQYVNDYLDAEGESIAPPATPFWVKDILSWAKSEGLR